MFSMFLHTGADHKSHGLNLLAPRSPNTKRLVLCVLTVAKLDVLSLGANELQWATLQNIVTISYLVNL